MTPNQLNQYLNTLIKKNITNSVMIWGAPGIGKSSIVQQLANEHQLDFVDLRLSQLAPTDLRGLPVPKNGITFWAPPEFLPTEGKGILFLDEINMAPPSMQGVAQQLILDRQIGNYRVPDGWFVWSAGNRKEDRAGVYDMPAPLANRFLHLEAEVDIDSFRQYAFSIKLNDRLIAFLAFRSELLHKIMPNEVAWPSPRSWVMANTLYNADLNIESAVGISAASEFYAYLEITENIPDIHAIVTGKVNPDFPDEVSLRYATVMSLVAQSKNAVTAVSALKWLVDKASPEWVQLYATDAFPMFRQNEFMPEVQTQIMNDTKLSKFLTSYAQMIAG